jgi:glycosyltransferase involved in cell wall biosynthesis
MDRLVVINDLSEAAGGATSLAIASAVGARRNGIAVTFISSTGPVSSDLIEAGVDVVQAHGELISNDARLLGVATGLFRLSSLRTVRDWIEQHDTPGTIYHLHNWSKFMSPSVFAALRPVAGRLVMTAHDFFLSCPNGAQYSFSEGRVCGRRANSFDCLLHSCDRRRHYADKLWRSMRHFARQRTLQLDELNVQLIAIHDGMIPGLVLGGVPEAKIAVIRNPIRPFCDRRVTAERNDEVLYVGRLSNEKGPDLAARAAALAGVRIRFVGEGPLSAMLKELVPDAGMEGWRSRTEIGKICQRARLVVMPSRWAEPYGLVAGEALWSGLPVVLSRNAFLAREIEESGAGVAVDTGDIDAFADVLRSLANDHVKIEGMSRRAIDYTAHIGNTLQAWETQQIALYESRLSH